MPSPPKISAAIPAQPHPALLIFFGGVSGVGPMTSANTPKISNSLPGCPFVAFAFAAFAGFAFEIGRAHV
mgnify:CR=1 FL=1